MTDISPTERLLRDGLILFEEITHAAKECEADNDEPLRAFVAKWRSYSEERQCLLLFYIVLAGNVFSDPDIRAETNVYVAATDPNPTERPEHGDQEGPRGSPQEQ